MANETDGVWRTVGGRRVFIKTGQSLSEAMKESGKFSKPKVSKEEKERLKKSPVVNNAPDEIADYLYEETGRSTVTKSEIDDYINNDFLDDELSDYQASRSEYEAVYKELKKRGYKVKDDTKKKNIVDEVKESNKEYVKKKAEEYKSTKDPMFEDVKEERAKEYEKQAVDSNNYHLDPELRKKDYENDMRFYEEMEKKYPSKGGLEANEEYQELKKAYESEFEQYLNKQEDKVDYSHDKQLAENAYKKFNGDDKEYTKYMKSEYGWSKEDVEKFKPKEKYNEERDKNYQDYMSGKKDWDQYQKGISDAKKEYTMDGKRYNTNSDKRNIEEIDADYYGVPSKYRTKEMTDEWNKARDKKLKETIGNDVKKLQKEADKEGILPSELQDRLGIKDSDLGLKDDYTKNFENEMQGMQRYLKAEEAKKVKTLSGGYEKDNKGREVSQKEYDEFRQAYKEGKISEKDYRSNNYDSLNKANKDDWVRNAFNQYKKDHPNTKMTLQDFMKNNKK